MGYIPQPNPWDTLPHQNLLLPPSPVLGAPAVLQPATKPVYRLGLALVSPQPFLQVLSWPAPAVLQPATKPVSRHNQTRGIFTTPKPYNPASQTKKLPICLNS